MHTSFGKISGLECKNCKSPRAITLCTSATRPRLVVALRAAHRIRIWAVTRSRVASARRAYTQEHARSV